MTLQNTADNGTTTGHPGKPKRVRTPSLPVNRTRRGRTRRFNLLCAQLAREIGHPLSLTENEVCRQASAVLVLAESMQAQILDGADVDVDEAVRLTSEARRIIATLHRRAVAEPTPPGPTLKEYLETLRDRAEADEVTPP
jgi:hypothetical protein